MNTLRNLEIEALGEQRWEKIARSTLARIERELVDVGDLPKRREHWWAHPALLVAAPLLSVLALVLFVTREQPRHAEVEPPSRITTGLNASHLALPGLALDVEPQSAVVVGVESSLGLLIVLDQGSIVCEVAPRAADRPLIIQAGGTRVRVLGTRFSVTRQGESARVKVEHGVVEVLSSGDRWRVQGGEEWPPVAPTPSARDALTPVANSDRNPEARHPLVRSRPSLSEALTERTGARSRSAPAPSSSVGEVLAVRETAPTLGPSRQDVFEQATALERGDPARAAQLYGSLESGADSWAQNALYARGRLEAARGNRAAAQRLLAHYLERFPQGSNAEDARAVLQRLR